MNSGDHGVSRHDQAVYDGDLDTKKVVLAVNALKCLISFCDGVLILTLGDHLESGHLWSLENRPLEPVQR